MITRPAVWMVGAAFALAAQGCAAPTDEEEADDEVESVAETTEAAAHGCPRKAPGAGAHYALCVWQSKEGREWLTIFNRRGIAVKGGEVTTSNVVLASEGPGAITCTGAHRLINFQLETSEHLKNFFSIEGCGNEGVHAYDEVGAKFDSHGCIRVKPPMSEWLRRHLVDPQTHVIKSDNTYIYIIPPK